MSSSSDMVIGGFSGGVSGAVVGESDGGNITGGDGGKLAVGIDFGGM
jgi:hypothetical protein